MATQTLRTAPVLSTPDTHIFEDPTPAVDVSSLPRLSDEQLFITYEIDRTVKEIRSGKWRRIALQFPDHMLVDAPRVFEALRNGLGHAEGVPNRSESKRSDQENVDALADELKESTLNDANNAEEDLYILADTSYGACCVDEVAAEHVDADVVVHYGRSCLSPPSRLPVIYVFTTRPLDLGSVLKTFRETYPSKSDRVILMADIPYSNHLSGLSESLAEEGYTNIYTTSIIHNPSSPLPNRTISTDVSGSEQGLRDYKLFHISEPPPSLLLTLSSRVNAIHIYPTETPTPPEAVLASSSMTLRRRYALLTKLTTASVFGILINTLSVKNYMHILDHVKKEIEAAGKKSYTFVVGKVNAAKVANFSEIDGWVVIGCWESSLIESKDFWKPLITPFELSLALKGDAERVWTGEWTADFQAILERKESQSDNAVNGSGAAEVPKVETVEGEGDFDSEEESAPPEFDLRTGRYVSHSRPMRTTTSSAKDTKKLEIAGTSSAQMSLAKRAHGDMTQVGGVVSPGAEYLRTQRTWQGLGTDFGAVEEEGAIDRSAARIEEGRRGIARGYVVGDDREAR
ncbi:diphthamide biosynthesis protein [Delitschia confertaspora ATCC 74209]|uniref:2-(3-amino-3-carboxypropyl)histidine synthase subunit 2 n=1 Tax=Delitschia confertaspora ATCC 74209 TaxID=1513339 RepID=A0A9P4MUR2_9PLEO|nr:diphthamide biosynthesis protein [Delitschia confertaspora ATCC 74209]